MNNIWNIFFKKRGRFYLLPHPDFQRIVEKFKLFKVKKVLDLGCGSGRHSVFLAESNFSVWALDNSSEALDLAQQWAKNKKLAINFVKDDFRKLLPFPDHSFDAVVAVDSIHYDTKQTVSFVLDETVRVLKQDGLLFLTLPTTTGNPLITHLIFTKEEIKKLLEDRFNILDKFIDKKKYFCVLSKVKE